MRQTIFSFALLLLLAHWFAACTGESATASPTNKVTTSTPSTNSSTARAKVDPGKITRDPVLGGPAAVTVRAKGTPQGEAFLIGILGDQRFRLDTATISQQGLLKFERKEGYPQGHYYVYFPNNKNFQVLMGEDQKFEVDIDLDDIFNSIKVKGSVDNEMLYENIRFEDDLRPQFAAVADELAATTEGSAENNAAKEKQAALVKKRKDQLQKDFTKYPNSLYTAFKTAGQNPDPRLDLPQEAQVSQYRKDFWANVDFADARLLRTPVIINKMKRYMNELTQQHVDSVLQSALYIVDLSEPYPDYFKFFANWIPLTYEPTKTQLMDPEKILVNVIQRYFTREKAFWADSMQIYGFQQRAREMQNSLFGNKGPNVTSIDQFGKEQTLYDKTADYLLVYMYNPECEHCQEQTPKLVDFYNQHKNNGVDVYAIAIDTDNTKWENYIKKTGMTFTNVFDDSNRSIYGKYYVDHTPELYVLNKDRIIIGKNLKVNQVMTVIERDRNKG